MNSQQAIFQKVFNDEVERTVLAYAPFGDILFKEHLNDGEVYKALQIYAKDGIYSDDSPFLFEVYTIGTNEREYTKFIQQGGIMKPPHLPEIYDKVFYREGLYQAITEIKRKSQYEVFVADRKLSDSYDIENTQKVKFANFCTLVLEFGKFD